MHKRIKEIRGQYDGCTIYLHWMTALIVIFQFLSAEFWDYFPQPEHHLLVLSHMSFGFALAVILTIRIAWRLSFGVKITEKNSGLLDRVAKALHLLLYVLLAAQVPLGFFTRWTDNQPLDVFGWLIASPLGHCSKVTSNLVDQIHDINAWVIMGMVGVHAIAALLHHFVWRDDVFRRMLPGAKRLAARHRPA
jgi:cytochrome b561